MKRYLCIHGHFYQPPREDPWMDEIFPEGSAAPFSNWNERICRESYTPLAWARRLDAEGRIADIMNCYEFISFNFGPTLLRWLERADPETYGRIIEADRKSVERFGHGSAMAQVCHHIIMPLAGELDKRLEVAWGIADFQSRFGRFPEGMWLSEAAVDTASLEALAEAGIKFTLLAPRQAKAVAPAGSGKWSEVDEDSLDIGRPYLVNLPSGRSIAVFFYNGPLSRAVAFERLLADGGNFHRQLINRARPGLNALATDGETYGHHFKFGEMALSYVLDKTRQGEGGLELTNFGAFLAANPPDTEVRLHEPSSWSCAHGVERWNSDCGCTDGGHPEWNQKWRGPLREALNRLKAHVDAHFFHRGEGLFSDPGATLMDYGRVYAGAVAEKDFEKEHFAPGISPADCDTAWKLLSMQNWALSSFASCAWFFDDIGRLEAVNSLTFALRALELAGETGAAEIEADVALALAQAKSNQPENGTGRDIWERQVRLRRETPHSLAAQALVRLWAEQRLPTPGTPAEVSWPGVSLSLSIDPQNDGKHYHGTMTIHWRLQSERKKYLWEVERPDCTDPFLLPLRIMADGESGTLRERPVSPPELSWKKKQAIAVAWAEHSAKTSWARQVEEARSAVWLFLPWQEGQVTQTSLHAWTRLFPGLAWIFAAPVNDCQPQAEKHLLRFLSDQTESHPHATLVWGRLTAEALRLIREEQAPDAALRLCKRAEQIGLAPEAWPLQNAVWVLGKRGEGWDGLRAWLRFASDGTKEAAPGGRGR